MQIEDVKKLADLSRIEMKDEEIIEISKDLDSILGYIKQIDSLKIEDITEDYQLNNIFREDENPYPSNEFTNQILKEAPDSLDGFVKVKKIL